MNEEEKKLANIARQWIKKNKKSWRDICSPEYFPSEERPVTTFLAGTPGAGKTELSKSLIEPFENPVIRLDADEIRDMMRDIGYNGSNAHVFQAAVGGIVSNIIAMIIKNKQSVVVDGTFTYPNWQQRIETALENNRIVEIYYLYQDPEVAWRFVKVREEKQGRYVPKHVFVDDYKKSIENVEQAINLFGERITVHFAKHNYEKKNKYVIVRVNSIVEHIPRMYTEEELMGLIEKDDQTHY